MGKVASDPVSQMMCTEIFPLVAKNHIARMPRPKEVLVRTDELGNVVQEQCRDTESISLYSTMKRTLIILAILDSKEMTESMLASLKTIVIAQRDTRL